MKKVYIETYGCQMNESDSEIVRSILHDSDYSFTDNEKEADIILLNTCSVRENANRKIFARVHQLNHANKSGKRMIGVLGCMVTNLQDSLKELPIDIIAGPDSYRNLPELLTRVETFKDQYIHARLDKSETYGEIKPHREKSINAWITIMRGCNNFCSFCVVPYTRGRERSRPIDEIINEAKILSNEGYPQVTLLGQNVNSYRDGKKDFGALIKEVCKINGIERIRFTSPHPKDFPENLIEIMATNPKICKQIHLPLQSGNDRILQLMRRTYTRQHYLNLVDKLRKNIPNLVLTTDIIVGFPTETDEEYRDTENVVKTVGYDSAFIFKYSEREGTLAAKHFKDDVSEDKKTKRIVTLNQIQNNISLQKNQAHVGQTFKCLIEKKGTRKSPHDFQARNDGNKVIILPPGDYKVGQFILAEITYAGTHSLKGKVIDVI